MAFIIQPQKLIQRVHSCIVGEPECGHMQARAVIREIANWLASHTDDDAAAYWAERLCREAENETLKEQALAELAEWENVMDIAPDSPIRRALEALPE